MNVEAQAFSVKRAEVEFHNFASPGHPERAIAASPGVVGMDELAACSPDILLPDLRSLTVEMLL